MRAIDTNVAARFIMADDPAQYRIARDILAAGALVPHTVLLELGWLLASRYEQSPEVIAAALDDLIDLPTVEVVESDLMRWAIARSRDGADLADMIHIASSRPATAFATFDRAVTKRAGDAPPIPVETLSV